MKKFHPNNKWIWSLNWTIHQVEWEGCSGSITEVVDILALYREDMIPWAYVQIIFFWWTLWSPTRPFSVRLSWVSSSRKPWFTTLKLDSNYSWVKLKKCFMDKFSMIEDLPKIKGDLTNIKQRDEERWSPLPREHWKRGGKKIIYASSRAIVLPMHQEWR